MRRALTAAVAVLVAILVTTATPVAAANTAVGSINTTANDFGTAATLDSVRVTGSGPSATVELEAAATEDLTTYTESDPNNILSVPGPDAVQFDGATANAEQQLYRQLGTAVTGDRTIEFHLNLSTFQDYARNHVTLATAGGQNYQDTLGNPYVTVDYGAKSGSLALTANTSAMSSRTTVAQLSTGTDYYVTVALDASEGEATYTVYDDAARTNSLGSAVVSYDDSATYDYLYAQQGHGAGFATPGTMDGNVSDLTIDTSGGADVGTYVGASHSVTNPQDGFTNLTLQNASATVTWQQRSSNTWNDVTSTTYTTSGNKTTDLSNTFGALRVNVTFEKTGDNPTAQLHDEGVTFTNDDPTVDNSTASPANSQIIATDTPTLSIDVDDPQFGTLQGETLTVEFFVDGSSVGTDTLSSAGTAEHTLASVGGGSHTWHAEVTDSYGGAATSDTFSFQAPDALEIRNESNASALVDNATVELRFYFDGEPTTIVERNTTDGTIDMTGLPTGRPFVVVANADGYYSRRIYVQSLVQTQTVYLLPESEQAVNPSFTLRDYSGEYPPDETVMLIQRALNRSGSLEWETVEGDYFGATGQFPAQLRYNVRHRLVLINTQTGDQRVIGPYTPVSDAERTITVQTNGTIRLDRPGAQVSFSPTTGTVTGQDSTPLAVTIAESNQTISSWSVTMTANTSGTTAQVYGQTGSGEATLSPSPNLTQYTGGTLEVTVTYTLADGSTGLTTKTYRIREGYDNQFSLLSVLGSVGTRLPDRHVGAFTSLVAVFVTVFATIAIAGTTRVSTELIGLVAVGLISGFAVIGWVGYNLAFVGGIGWVSLAALRRGL